MSSIALISTTSTRPFEDRSDPIRSPTVSYMLYVCDVPKGLAVIVRPLHVLKVWREYLDQHRVVFVFLAKPTKASHEDRVDQARSVHSDHHRGGGCRSNGVLQGYVLKGHCCAGAAKGVLGLGKLPATRLDLLSGCRSETGYV